MLVWAGSLTVVEHERVSVLSLKHEPDRDRPVLSTVRLLLDEGDQLGQAHGRWDERKRHVETDGQDGSSSSTRPPASACSSYPPLTPIRPPPPFYKAQHIGMCILCLTGRGCSPSWHPLRLVRLHREKWGGGGRAHLSDSTVYQTSSLSRSAASPRTRAVGQRERPVEFEEEP